MSKSIFGWFALSTVMATLCHASGIEQCSPEKMAKANPGYQCLAGASRWAYFGDSYLDSRVYLNIDTGMRVTAPLDRTCDAVPSHLGDYCTNGYRLPSGYPGRDGRDGFPPGDSDFMQIEREHFRQVVPGLKGDRFWSSSVDPGDPGTVYFFDTSSGDPYPSSYLCGPVLCVSG